MEKCRKKNGTSKKQDRLTIRPTTIRDNISTLTKLSSEIRVSGVVAGSVTNKGRFY